MRTMITFLAVVTVVSGLAQDIRDKVASPAAPERISETIDPDLHIYGIPFGTSEDEFISRFGKPTAYLRLSANESGMVYGKKHCFLFTNSRLSGVYVSYAIIDHKLMESI